MNVYAAVLVLSLRLALGARSPEGGAVEKRQSRYICGTEPYRFYSDVPCNAYTLCPNGGVKTFVGCSTNFQCQIHDADTVCINSCCCTLPRVLENSTYPALYDSGIPSSSLPAMAFLLVFTALM